MIWLYGFWICLAAYIGRDIFKYLFYYIFFGFDNWWIFLPCCFLCWRLIPSFDRTSRPMRFRRVLFHYKNWASFCTPASGCDIHMDYTFDFHFFVIKASVAFIFVKSFNFDVVVLHHEFIGCCWVDEAAGRYCIQSIFSELLHVVCLQISSLISCLGLCFVLGFVVAPRLYLPFFYEFF